MNILSTGMLDPVRYLPSTHYDERPNDTAIDMIVVHNISLPPGQFGQGHIEQFFCGQLRVDSHPYFSTIAGLKVTSHLLIDREGRITQFVPFNKRAWHAGESFFQGRPSCNDFSIGIELEGTDELPYEKLQYIQLANMIKLLMTTYPAITPERIVGHCDISPSRKTDPGRVFDWLHLKNLIDRSKDP